MQEFLEYFTTLSPTWMYIWLFLGSYVENVFSPFPGDSVVVFGGYLSGLGTLNLTLVLIVTVVGSMLGFMTLFFAGKYWGKKIIENGKLINPNSQEYLRTEAWFDKYGYWVVVTNRFLPGVRSIVSIFAGLSHLNITKVVIYSGISTFIWNLILVGGGFKLGENWEGVLEYIKNYNIVILAVMFIASIIFVYRWKNSNRENN